MNNVISACIIDIDATITNDRNKPQMNSEYPLDNAVVNVLADLAKEHGRKHTEVRQALKTYADEHVFWDYPDLIHCLALPENEAWTWLEQWHREEIIVYPDAVEMVKILHAAEMPLYIVSNNPLSGCHLKLQRAGLAKRDGSAWFREVFGSNVCMGQKSQPEFWNRCLDRIGIPPGEIAIVGDNPKEDGAVPRSCGVGTVVLVDRKRVSRMEKTPEAILTNTLDCAPGLLLSKCGIVA
ncbi:MAG: HAD family hydrolase [Chthoniobacterales bacterium]